MIGSKNSGISATLVKKDPGREYDEWKETIRQLRKTGTNLKGRKVLLPQMIVEAMEWEKKHPKDMQNFVQCDIGDAIYFLADMME